MPNFFYKATNAAGKIETGVLEVTDKKRALQRLEKMGLFPISVSSKKSTSREINFNQIDLERFLPGKSMSGKNVLDFTEKLGTLLRAGLPLAKALKLLIDTTDHEPSKEIIREVLKDVNAGTTFADALGKHPKVFERLYVNMVRTGEAAGVLEQVLANVRDYLQTRQDLKSFLITSLIYPSILGLTGLGTVLVLVLFVLPSFQDVFDQIGQDLPWITQLLVDITGFMAAYKWFLAVAVIGGAIGFSRWKNTDEGREKWDRFKLRLPVMGSILTEIEVNRFSRTMGILLRSSVSLLEALSISREITENKIFQKAMDPIVKGVKKGDGMSTPMSQSGVFPKMAVQLVTVGEETGTLGDMFIKISDIYQANLERTIKRVLAMFEPVMILVMFVVVGFIVAAMLMAVTSLSSTSL
ncbi:MAG: type II secretion system F family protein [Acidobacteriota bacterium]|nr:type II secretion system F family protein [Acidobacteriota bacterium]